MTEEKKFQYRVKPGYRHGIGKAYGPGDIVEMTEFEASGFLDKLELVATAPAETAPSIDATDGAIEFAAESGVELSDVASWSGKSERLTKPDVEAFVKAQKGE